MINHARTLLLNVSGSNRPTLGTYGEEYIPTFSPVNVPTYLTKLNTTLFGLNPDYVFMNYRARELMSVLHSTEFRSYVTDLDSRIAYDLQDNTFFDIDFGSVIDTITANNNLSPSIIGTYIANSVSGRMYDTWTVTLGNGSVTSVNNITNSANGEAWSIAGNISPAYALGESNLSIIFSQTGAPLAASGAWKVTSLAKPASISNLEVKIKTLGAEHMTSLFSGDEPYKTFKALWETHPQFHYRLTGILLAMIYKTEAYRVGELST
jgi:hypothetical protein